MNFQRSRGLNPDGIVGPLTWAALMPECYGAQIPEYPGFLIRFGARGDYVRQIQTCLNSVNNAGLATDGIFGPLTQAAVINYQRANGLSPDGIVGPITWEHLFRRCAGGPMARAAVGFSDEPSLSEMPSGVQFVNVAGEEVPPIVHDNAPAATIPRGPVPAPTEPDLSGNFPTASEVDFSKLIPPGVCVKELLMYLLKNMD